MISRRIAAKKMGSPLNLDCAGDVRDLGDLPFLRLLAMTEREGRLIRFPREVGAGTDIRVLRPQLCRPSNRSDRLV